MKSQLITATEGANGAVTVTTTDATMVDILTTAISTNTAVTGMYGLVQRTGIFVAGMATQSKLKTNSFNFLK